MAFELGDPVALKADPSRQGIVVGGPRITGTVTRWQVQFTDGTRELPSEKSLVRIGGDTKEFSLDDEIELFKRFRFSKVDQLKLTLTHNKLSGKLANLIYRYICNFIIKNNLRNFVINFKCILTSKLYLTVISLFK